MCGGLDFRMLVYFLRLGYMYYVQGSPVGLEPTVCPAGVSHI